MMAHKKLQPEELQETEMSKIRIDSPTLKPLQDPVEIIDQPYFFEDRPPTPKYIHLPPGVEVSTQIQDNELFDFELEVEPILQVLVGRSLVSATYELIKEEERKEYLEHKKK